MTLTGTVNRWARLRNGERAATVTRISAGTEPVFLVETWGDLGPVFTPCPTWRAALAVAADSLAL